MNNDQREQNVARLLWSCNDMQELNDFITAFNNAAKICADHLERMEELQRGLHKD